ncbi:MAG: hypothetical protein ACPHN2_08620 [Sinimarinibacterium flocculans]|uniref:hypothetical protein n=1 Tax=Sinimarinibacterium flocculans TaxID=985250 RepID=UPI003C47DBDA
MDIANIEAAPRELQIVNPTTHEPIGLTLTLLPSSDDRVRAAARRIQNERLARRAVKVTAEQLEAQGAAMLVAHISGWKWAEGVTFGGETLAFNEENVRKVLKKAWIRKQVDDATTDEASFFEGSPTS